MTTFCIATSNMIEYNKSDLQYGALGNRLHTLRPQPDEHQFHGLTYLQVITRLRISLMDVHGVLCWKAESLGANKIGRTLDRFGIQNRKAVDRDRSRAEQGPQGISG